MDKFNLRSICLLLLRSGDNFGVAGPMFYNEALEYANKGQLDDYDFWKIISFNGVLHSKAKSINLLDKLDFEDLNKE